MLRDPVAPHYAVWRRRRPLLLETMLLRVDFLQQWFDPPDPAAEALPYQSESMRCFAPDRLG